MGRLSAVVGRLIRDDARTWSVLALFAGIFAAVLDAVVIAGQDDKSSLLWPVILLPVVLVPLPVLVSRRPARIGAALAMTGWCWLTGFSVGLLFIPCLLLMIVAAARDDA